MLEVTVKVSAPYTPVHLISGTFRPGWTKRDYRAEVFGHKIHLTSKSEIQNRIRILAYQNTGSNRVHFTFEQEEA